MSVALALVVGALSGTAVGALYFLWLWRSVQRLTPRRHAVAWMLAGSLMRLAFAFACLALLARWAGWQALVAALVGFIMARMLLLRRLREARPDVERTT